MVDELDITVVLLLLLLRILWLGRGERFTRLLCDLPEGVGRPIQSEEGVKGGEVGAGVDVGAGCPGGVLVDLGVRRSLADLRPSRDLMLGLSGTSFLPSLDLTVGPMRGLSCLYAWLPGGGPW